MDSSSRKLKIQKYNPTVDTNSPNSPDCFHSQPAQTSAGSQIALSQGRGTDLSSLLLCQSEDLRLMLLRKESDVYKATADSGCLCEEPVTITFTPFPSSLCLHTLSHCFFSKNSRKQAPGTHLPRSMSHLSLSPSAPKI